MKKILKSKTTCFVVLLLLSPTTFAIFITFPLYNVDILNHDTNCTYKFNILQNFNITTKQNSNIFNQNFENEQMEFYFENKIFTYNLADNIKFNDNFEMNFELNKYNRFCSHDERKNLLQKLTKIGVEKTIALDYIFPNLMKNIEKFSKNIKKTYKNAEIISNFNTKNIFSIKKEQQGISLDMEKLYEKIYNNILEGKDLKIQIPTKITMPTITYLDLQNQINLRSEFTTDISTSSANRKHNIKNAINKLNMSKIAPNEIFSFNKHIGKRTEENGYREAKIIIDNEFVDGIGGGVCQVSSTLYNSALLAGLSISESNKHSKPVSYVKQGFDSMVNFGSSDLKIKNNTNSPITIVALYNSNKITIKIFGESLNCYTYSLKSEQTKTSEPQTEYYLDKDLKYADKVEYEDESFLLKSGHCGYNVKSYRETYYQNKLVSCELLRNDNYPPQNEIIIMGTKKRTEQQCAFLFAINNKNLQNIL